MPQVSRINPLKSANTLMLYLVSKKKFLTACPSRIFCGRREDHHASRKNLRAPALTLKLKLEEIDS